MRVYDQRADRRAYFLFSVVATLILFGVAGLAFFRPWLGSVLATVYLSWSSWHYTGQNYGISVMFLRRRGVALDWMTQRILHGSFFLSFLLVLLVIHGTTGGTADPSVEVRLVSLAIPTWINDRLLAGLLLAYLGLTLAWIVLLARRSARVTDLMPTMLIALVQAL